MDTREIDKTRKGARASDKQILWRSQKESLGKIRHMDQDKMVEDTQASRVHSQHTDTTLQTQMILGFTRW